MSSFAIFVIIIAVIAAFLGWRSGLMRQIGQLAGILIGIVACRMYGPTAVSIFNKGNDSVLLTVLAYVLLFIVVYIIVTLLVNAVRKFLSLVCLGLVDRLAGAVFRVGEWLFILSLIVNLWTALMPQTSLMSDPWYRSILEYAPYLLGTDTAARLASIVSSAIH